MPWSPGLILPRCARSALYAELRKEQLQPRVQAPNGPRRATNKSFGTLLKHWYGRNLSDLTLATYIAASARRSPGGPDYCLTIEDGYTRRPAIWWRANQLYGPKLNCPKGHPFKRSCILECRLIDNWIFDRYRYLTDEQGNPILQYKPEKAGKYYCIMDDLLNRRYYDEFTDAMETLMDMIHE